MLLRRVIRFLDRFIAVLAAVALVAAFAMILLNVFNRYVVLGWLRAGSEQSETVAWLFNVIDGPISPFSVTADEVPGLLLVWIAFLGAYLAYRKGGHIAFDMVLKKLPNSPRNIIRFLSDGMILIFLIMLFHQSVRMISVDGATEIETADISQGWFMGIIPLAAVLLILALLIDNIERWRPEKFK